MWKSRVLLKRFVRLPPRVRFLETKPEAYNDAVRVSSWPKPAEKVPEDQGCPLCRAGLQNFGYRDVLLLRQFLTPAGLIIGRRQTGICRKSQRRLAKAIKRSRQMGFLPNYNQPKQHKGTDSKPPQS